MKALDCRSVCGQAPNSPWLDDDATTRLCWEADGSVPLDSASGDPELEVSEDSEGSEGSEGSLERFKTAPLYWKTALEQE